ncbi:hypothetical protein Syun_018310 [Stephania yunnanensis]|uniref:Uncharacterized protein n=1 Tax=Stephania yunnanensis TaxID=152371 RepID=A0AAP0ITH9_9MAGN
MAKNVKLVKENKSMKLRLAMKERWSVKLITIIGVSCIAYFLVKLIIFSFNTCSHLLELSCMIRNYVCTCSNQMLSSLL